MTDDQGRSVRLLITFHVKYRLVQVNVSQSHSAEVMNLDLIQIPAKNGNITHFNP